MSHDTFALKIVAEPQGQVLLTTEKDQAKPQKDPGKAAQVKLAAVLEMSEPRAETTALGPIVVEQIMPQVLETLMTKILPIADRGSILLLDAATGQMIPTAQRHKDAAEDDDITISRTVLDLVLREKQAVRSTDTGSDKRFQNSASVVLQDIHSMMCVPLLSLAGEPIGIIHVDSHSTFSIFSAADMDILTAIANQAALAYESARQLRAREALRAEMQVARHRTLAQLVSGLAHELNTPLGIMTSAASVIDETSKELTARDLDEETKADLGDVREAVELMQQNITRASQLISEFKKLSTQQFAEQRDTVDIAELIGEIVDAAKGQPGVSEHHLQLANHLDPGALWEGCPGHLTQVVISLIDNAGRHAYDAPGQRIDVHLSRVEDGDRRWYRLQVVDFGRGIPVAQHEQIFEPFWTTARSRGCRGLGLAIARSLATDSLAATIEVHSAPQQGTMMALTLRADAP